MTTPTEEYQSKLRTVTQILDLIQPHDTIVAGCTGDEPVEVLRELHTIHDQVSDIKVLLFGLPEPYEFAMNPKYSDVFYTASSFSVVPVPPMRGGQCISCHRMGMMPLIPRAVCESSIRTGISGVPRCQTAMDM